MKHETAAELLARAEEETHTRLDYDDPHNPAMAVVIGALARALGKTPPSYTERDDFAAGMLIRHQMSPEGQREAAAKDMLREMLLAGLGPDELGALFGRK